MVKWSVPKEVKGYESREEERRVNRLRIALAIRRFEKSPVLTYYDSKSRRVVSKKDEFGLLAFGDLLKILGLSRAALYGHLVFLAKKGYLLSKNGVYRFNPEFEEDFKRISTNMVAWLGSQILLKSDRAFKQKNPRAFNRYLRPDLIDEGYEEYSDEIKRFALEEKKRRGIEL
jgi:hypothetical protein